MYDEFRDGRVELDGWANGGRPVVSELFSWLEEMLQSCALLPLDPFTKFAQWVRDRRRGLQVCLGDPGVPLDTSRLERAHRPIPM